MSPARPSGRPPAGNGVAMRALCALLLLLIASVRAVTEGDVDHSLPGWQGEADLGGDSHVEVGSGRVRRAPRRLGQAVGCNSHRSHALAFIPAYAYRTAAAGGARRRRNGPRCPWQRGGAHRRRHEGL